MPLVLDGGQQKLRETVARYPERDGGHAAGAAPGASGVRARLDEAIEGSQAAGFGARLRRGDLLHHVQRSVGTYHVQVCKNVSCKLDGGYDCLRVAQAADSVAPETFTVSEVECLASCGTAVCVQVNDDYHEQMNVQRLEALLGELGRRG